MTLPFLCVIIGLDLIIHESDVTSLDPRSEAGMTKERRRLE